MSKAFSKNRRRRELFCSAVVVAAGASTRMGEDKMFMPLGGIPVLARSLTAFESCDAIDEIVVVTNSEAIIDVAHLCRDYNISKASKVLVGGATRLESALAGLSEISDSADLAAIHDGARPLVSREIIEKTAQAAAEHLAAAPALPVRDTIKFVRDGSTVSTPDRETLMSTQTPQIFEADLIKAALTDAFTKGLNATDDSAAVEALGVKVRLTEGSEENIKITTAFDITVAEAILRNRGEIK